MAKEQGLSLADIGPATENVTIGENAVPFRGISTEDILILFQRFPELKTIVGGGGFKAQDLVELAPRAVSAIIAAGHSELGDEAAEHSAATYGVETQLDILEAVGRLTFKSGFGPFVNRLIAMSDVAVSLSNGKVPGMPLPPALSPSLPQDTTQAPSGS
jgi:hypothetical protein